MISTCCPSCFLTFEGMPISPSQEDSSSMLIFQGSRIVRSWQGFLPYMHAFVLCFIDRNLHAHAVKSLIWIHGERVGSSELTPSPCQPLLPLDYHQIQVHSPASSLWVFGLQKCTSISSNTVLLFSITTFELGAFLRFPQYPVFPLPQSQAHAAVQ